MMVSFVRGGHPAIDCALPAALNFKLDLVFEEGGEAVRSLRNLGLAAILAIGWFAFGWTSGSPLSAAEPVVLTVTGEAVQSNRPDFDPFQDAFLAFSDNAFQNAHALTYGDLAALPQAEITAAADGWAAPISARGPRLADVLAKAGVSEEASVALVALDGYAVMLDPVARKLHDWVLAIETDSHPLGIGGRGPAWLMYESGDMPADADAEAQWVWSVYLITVE
jgi:hypothetical protein